MGAQIAQLGCCGVAELRNIREEKTPEDILVVAFSGYSKNMATKGGAYYQYFRVMGQRFNFHQRTTAPRRMGHVIFTQVNNAAEGGDYGEKLAEYIQEHKLGDLAKSLPAANPNYTRGHTITMWTWTPSPKRCWQWWLETKSRREDLKNAKDASERLSYHW